MTTIHGQAVSERARRRTPASAWVALVLAVLWIGGVGSAVAIVIAIVGLRRPDRAGRAVLLAALVVATVGLIVTVVSLALAVGATSTEVRP